jgi:enoyl-CoA hydratase/carnithine racemase
MSLLKQRRDGRVVVATFDNPPHALMNNAIVEELDALVSEAERDEGIGAVVFHGAHPERFLAHFDVGQLLAAAESAGVSMSSRTAGAGLRAVSALRRIPGAEAVIERTPAAGLAELERFHELLLRMNRAGVTFIAALDGSALGGGCEFALACDIRVMADGDFLIGQPEILLGIIPGGGGTQRLARLLGGGWAAELVLEGRALSPDEAYSLGLVHEIVEPERLMEAVLERAHRLARRPRVAVAAAKRAIYFGGSQSLEHGLHTERAGFMETLSSKPARRGLRAYVDGLRETGELPAYDGLARERLIDGSYVNLTSGD